MDRDLPDMSSIFKNIILQDNTINVDPIDLLKNLGGYWPPYNSYSPAVPYGMVPNEPVINEIKLINNKNNFVIVETKSISLLDKIKNFFKRICKCIK